MRPVFLKIIGASHPFHETLVSTRRFSIKLAEEDLARYLRFEMGWVLGRVGLGHDPPGNSAQRGRVQNLPIRLRTRTPTPPTKYRELATIERFTYLVGCLLLSAD